MSPLSTKKGHPPGQIFIPTDRGKPLQGFQSNFQVPVLATRNQPHARSWLSYQCVWFFSGLNHVTFGGMEIVLRPESLAQRRIHGITVGECSKLKCDDRPVNPTF